MSAPFRPFPSASIAVHKYGGSSVATPELIRKVAARVASCRKDGQKIAVVVSAMGKTTNGLIDLANSVSAHPVGREMDMLLATGEQVSASLLSMALNDLGIPAVSLNAFQIGMMTTETHSSARVRDLDSSRLRRELDERGVVVVTGFQGITASGDLTTLGRGGSDTSAVAIAASLGCPCEIYSDVAGVFAGDPHAVAGAKRLEYVTWEEMLELASLGAKVLHSRAVEIAEKYDVPLYCGATFSEERGTYIVKGLPEWLEQPVVTGVALARGQVRVSLTGVPAETAFGAGLFTALAEQRINLDMIVSTSEENGTAVLGFSAASSDVEAICATLKRFPAAGGMTIDDRVAKVSAVGVGMQSASGVAGQFFSALAEAGVTVLSVTTSEIKISVLVPDAEADKAQKALMERFGLVE